MASSVECFGKVDMGKSVLLTDNEFGNVMSEVFESIEVVYSSNSLVIHSIVKGKAVYTLSDTGSEKVLSRIV
ncbi:hypothetical protein [Xenorhabdus hominickii]|uniref:Uncharacterized protein n=1 Tax=Xenorhabdus hominickii TaxID=351679 RepID=A0A1V0M454_XENHO|nr:hypothetical protein [Xenorhabdus hominickii]ARD69645.1 hypothetical protein [Xenorhabdus hominickii]PHM52359.1 hypothetical protein Xhom_04436 [Xenorhabdus hominickii]